MCRVLCLLLVHLLECVGHYTFYSDLHILLFSVQKIQEPYTSNKRASDYDLG